MNFIIIESYLLEDLTHILLTSGYSVLIEKINNNKVKVTFLGGENND